MEAALEAALDADGGARVRLFSGYTGWGSQQLEGEVAQSAWFVSRPAGSCDAGAASSPPRGAGADGALRRLTAALGGATTPLSDVEMFDNGETGGAVPEMFGGATPPPHGSGAEQHAAVLDFASARWAASLNTLGGEYADIARQVASAAVWVSGALSEDDAKELMRRGIG